MGITPARAGKRLESRPDGRAARNYPRSRGEETRATRGSGHGRELPPLARGRGSPASRSVAPSGITPARAGKSKQGRGTLALERNYPRSRGEETPLITVSVACRELPPLARGRVTLPMRPSKLAGITPARAGKSDNLPPAPSNARNYPRSRGEESYKSLKMRIRAELPPLARGRARPRPDQGRGRGITPARAGKRHCSNGGGAAGGNYPRSRGEERSPGRARWHCLELPPLARGRGAGARPRC